jgi:hypothetical protein
MPGPKEMGLVRANGYAENLGHLFIHHLLKVTQDQDKAIPKPGRSRKGSSCRKERIIQKRTFNISLIVYLRSLEAAHACSQRSMYLSLPEHSVAEERPLQMAEWGQHD